MKDYVVPIELQSVDTSGIAVDTWVPFNTAGLEGSCFMITFTNDSTVDVVLSYDGVTEHEFLTSYTDKTLYFQTNSSPSNYKSMIKKGTVIYVRGAAGQGDIYLSGYYNE